MEYTIPRKYYKKVRSWPTGRVIEIDGRLHHFYWCTDPKERERTFIVCASPIVSVKTSKGEKNVD